MNEEQIGYSDRVSFHTAIKKDSQMIQSMQSRPGCCIQGDCWRAFDQGLTETGNDMDNADIANQVLVLPAHPTIPGTVSYHQCGVSHITRPLTI
ncbi:MAG TPA: hypothetical protein ENK01_02370 [Hellea balneolensis]|uniref:Uncharacterized protein n=1 Tax=Hellea balneolensis TaxID=287478 RepID=A0A7V5NWY7_9PROT|nr:hypothetical protein [Hellea balneolensis]